MRIFFIIVLVFSLLPVFSQIEKEEELPVIDLRKYVNVGYRKAVERKIDVIVLHSTHFVDADSFSIQGVLQQFRQYKVGAHYIIGREGQIYYAVSEKDVAFHAGVSRLPESNRTNLNASSIGIEIINTPHTPPSEAQYEALVRLIKDIKRRHAIAFIVRHSDIAPDRKTDPWQFDWQWFKISVE
ncbi:MAG: N-acetylmuramoyl-L-alanine amidase [Prevotellaceae bacterium]|jgi:N-acetyl-anhydromuramyl-L-alanine amidase AmpD|nr:N-acetylmuramoyl-L-alanine amidase [Prevotellaceae bacterium]